MITARYPRFVSTLGQLGMLDLNKHTISGDVQRVQENLPTLNIMNMRDMLHLAKLYQQSLVEYCLQRELCARILSS